MVVFLIDMKHNQNCPWTLDLINPLILVVVLGRRVHDRAKNARVIKKVNFDAIERPNSVFLAIVHQNHLGKIIHAWIDVNVHGDPPWAEAKTGFLALTSVVHFGLDHAIF